MKIAVIPIRKFYAIQNRRFDKKFIAGKCPELTDYYFYNKDTLIQSGYVSMTNGCSIHAEKRIDAITKMQEYLINKGVRI